MRTKNLNPAGMFMLALFVAFFAISCDNNDNVDLVNNEEQRQEAFNQILNNQKVYNDFMTEMRSNPQAMNWMMENRDFTNEMFRDENLNYMNEHNPGMNNMMMNHMTNRMDSDTAFERQMNTRIEERNQLHRQIIK